MTIEETIAVAGKTSTSESQEQFSADWWQRRTAEELRDIIKRGFAGGEAFQGAVAEAERRARDVTRKLREKAAIESEARRKRRLVLLGSLAAVSVTIAAGTWLIG
jgi:ribosomal protein S19E (S16A)